MKNFKTLLVLLILTTVSYAQIETPQEIDEVIITTTKFEENKEHVGKVITIITQKDLENSKGQTLSQILNTVAGIEINGANSTQGKNQNYFIRGGKNKQVLVLIDGVPVIDPSGIAVNYDLNLVSLEAIASIEIQKGASSTLHGSGAGTAVISIRLKKASAEKIHSNFGFSIGTNQSQEKQDYNVTNFNQNASISGTVKKVNYLASVNYTNTRGLSEAFDETKIGFKDDPFSSINVFTKLGFEIHKKWQLDFFGNYDKIDHAYDFAFTDSEVNNLGTEQGRVGLTSKYTYTKGIFKINASAKKASRFDSSIYGESLYDSRSIVTDVFNKYTFSDAFFLVGGIDFQFQDANTESPYETIAKEKGKYHEINPYITGVYTAKNFNFNIGGRYNNHEIYGSHFTYNINPSYNFKFSNTTVKALASYSTAYIVPSLFQLYSSYGNVGLTPEENTTIEAGFDISNKKKLDISAVFFYREENNAIQFITDPLTYASQYINDTEGTLFARGVETEIAYKISERIGIKANYTYTSVAKDRAYLIPKNKINAQVNMAFSKRTNASIGYTYTAKRTTQDFRNWPATIETLESYNLVNLFANHTVIANRLTVFGSLTNVFNEDYTESLGYTTKGRNVNIGITLQF